ncbi:MAG: bifunctional nuclease family protein [Desulfohalobiaceae bacterium]|nr:bifunctional nuclease family protein [Desulfohalobiaceae bacterium]
MIEMKIFGLALDEQSQVPLLILKDTNEEYVLPIWIGAMEAMSISITLNKVNISRPLTHDLMLSILNGLEVSILKVVITELKEGTYYAEIHLEQGEIVYKMDSRPSDAIALAVRSEAPIYASEELLEKVSFQFSQDQEAVLKDQESEKWTELLEKFNIDDFKYNQ